MREQANNSYTSEFKELSVKLALKNEQPISHTAKELGVNVNTLYTWINKYSRPLNEKVTRSDEHIYDEVV